MQFWPMWKTYAQNYPTTENKDRPTGRSKSSTYCEPRLDCRPDELGSSWRHHPESTENKTAVLRPECVATRCRSSQALCDVIKRVALNLSVRFSWDDANAWVICVDRPATPTPILLMKNLTAGDGPVLLVNASHRTVVLVCRSRSWRHVRCFAAEN
jgi:hypothetical protein